MKKPDSTAAASGPFAFVCYSHRDAPTAYKEIQRLQRAGIRVWYDEGIGGGDEWADSVATAIAESTAFFFFVTQNSVQSEHCRREINFAHDCATAVTPIYLEPTTLPAGLKLSLSNRQAIMKYELPESDYEKKITSLSAANGLEPDNSLLNEAPEKSQPSVPISTDIQAPSGRPGIAILPFQNRSSDQDIDFICEGIADEIIASMSDIEGIRIISSNSATKVNQQTTDIQTIGTQLDVKYILEGSIQKSLQRLRITAKLPSTQSDEILWAERWDCMIDQIFDVQETIAISVLKALQVQLSATESAHLVERHIPDIQAYEFYLRARQLTKTFSETALQDALDYLRQGETIVGENAYIIAAMGQIYWQFHNAGIDSGPKNLAAAEQCVARLFDLDPNSVDGHRLSGLLKAKNPDSIFEAIKHLRVALKAHPNDPETLLWLSLIFAAAGQITAAKSLADHLLNIDPLTTVNHVLPGFINMLDGNLTQATGELLYSHEMNPGNPITTLVYGQALAMTGDSAAAIPVFRSLKTMLPDTFFSRLGELFAASLEGDAKAALRLASDQLKSEAQTDWQYSWTLAQCFAVIGNSEEAIDWLTNAVRHGWMNYPVLNEYDPLLESLRGHERFHALMADVKARWLAFDA
ncbi:MAG: TIR domain-containing protein [Luminiphilus sp.]|nr:TIR domain-containing protein [Luminiphilus sp.]